MKYLQSSVLSHPLLACSFVLTSIKLSNHGQNLPHKPGITRGKSSAKPLIIPALPINGVIDKHLYHLWWHRCCSQHNHQTGLPKAPVIGFYTHNFCFMISKSCTLSLFQCFLQSKVTALQLTDRLWDGLENAMNWQRARNSWQADMRIERKLIHWRSKQVDISTGTEKTLTERMWHSKTWGTKRDSTVKGFGSSRHEVWTNEGYSTSWALFDIKERFSNAVTYFGDWKVDGASWL